MGKCNPWKCLRMVGLMGLWQAANLAGFIWQFRSGRSRESSGEPVR
jgi:hypothetical protein